MSSYTHQTVPTQFVEANVITFAYRRFGKKVGIPLVFNPHILGNLDSWDPAVTDGLAQSREVILFDNAGIGKSSGEVPNTFGDMARDAGLFIEALGLKEVDVLGFSIGSMIAQNIALLRPDLVRKLVLVGSGPRNGDGHPANHRIAGDFRKPVRESRRLLDRWIFSLRQLQARLLAERFSSVGISGLKIGIHPSATRCSQLNSLPFRNGADQLGSASLT